MVLKPLTFDVSLHEKPLPEGVALGTLLMYGMSDVPNDMLLSAGGTKGGKEERHCSERRQEAETTGQSLLGIP